MSNLKLITFHLLIIFIICLSCNSYAQRSYYERKLILRPANKPICRLLIAHFNFTEFLYKRVDFS